MGSIREYLQEFKALKETRLAFWGVQVINFLDCVFIFAYASAITIFLSNEIGFGDVGAGMVMAIFSIVACLIVFVSGPLVDRLGIKKALYLSLFALVFIRVSLAICGFWPHFGIEIALPGLLADVPFRKILTVSVAVLGALPGAMLSVIYQISNRHFTSEVARSPAFNVWYAVMNVGAIGAGFLFDFIHKTLDAPLSWVFVIGAVFALVNVVAALTMVRTSAGYGETEPPKKSGPRGLTEFLRYFAISLSTPSFRRVLAAVALLIGTRAAFLYTSALTPKYWLRVIGDDAQIGMLQNINPLIIVVGLICVIPLIKNCDVYKMLTRGAILAAFCFAPLAIPWYWVSDNIVWSYYAMSIAAMVILSFGEILWSPRLNDYIVSCAPEGQSGMYASIAQLPWFAASTIASGLSGFMLAKWVPETVLVNGIENVPLQTVLLTKELPYWQTPEAMWLVLTVVAVIGPILMLFMKDWFTKDLKHPQTSEVK